MKKIILFSTLLFCYSTQIYASKIIASSFGYSITNSSSAFQQAIENPADTTVIDFTGNGEWNIGPHVFFNLLNKTIIFEKGVKLIATSGYGSSDCLLQIKYATNVKIIGNNTLFKMPRAEYFGDQSRMGLSIIDCANIEVSNLNITDSGEDGIFISAYGGGGTRPTEIFSKNIILKNIICNNNRRQGISIISAQNVLVEHCSFKNTNGTLPEAGVDFEPDHDYERLENITFRKCSFTGNYGSGIQVTSLNLNSTSTPISITFDDCYVSQNKQPGHGYVTGEIYLASPKTNQAVGGCTFNRCFVNDSQNSALFIAKAADGYSAIFNDCVFKNISQVGTQYICPIWFENLNYYVGIANDAVGGAVFNNVFVQYNVNVPIVGSYGSVNSAGLKNITGNLKVYNTLLNNATAAPIYPEVTAFNNVSFNYNLLATLPQNTISVVSDKLFINEANCNKNIFAYTRTGATDLPLPITYTLSGIANNMEDYLFMPAAMIIPSGTNLNVDTLTAFEDYCVEATETIILNTTTQNNYSIGSPTSFTTTVQDGVGVCSVLAAKEIIFTGKKQDEYAALNFSITDTEVQNYFVEKSENGIQFIGIGKLNYSNKINTYFNYSFTDTKTLSSKNYYRIYFYENSTKKYSETILITNNLKSILVYPNPVKDLMHYSTNLKITKVELYDITGKLIQHFTPTSASLKLNALPKGIFIAKFFDAANNIFMKQIIKQ